MASSPASTRTSVLAAYEKLQYGMFIHYGMSTYTGIEIPRTPAPLADFPVDKAEPEQWARVAKEAGMTYAVLTTKHCYGHCLWPSKYTDYRVPDGHDIVRRFVDACRREGIKPGFYYLLGWDCDHQPKMNPEQYEKFVNDQLAELLTNYGPIVELWLDISWDLGADCQAALQRLYDHLHKLQPNCLVMFSQSDNVLNGRPPFVPTHATYFYRDTGNVVVPFPTDITNGERTPPGGKHDPHMTILGKQYYIPMEVCDTLRANWFSVEGDEPRPLRFLQHMYQDSVDRGANLLLDVPPDKTGRIPESSVERLMELKAARNEKLSDYAKSCKATCSNVYHGDHQWSAEKAVDGNGGTRWATDDDQHSAWLEVDLGRDRTLSHVFVTEAYGRVRSYHIEASNGGEWKTVAKGEKIGDGAELDFPPVKASKVKIVIDDSTEGPTLPSFEVW